jgi:hypothetical protein
MEKKTTLVALLRHLIIFMFINLYFMPSIFINGIILWDKIRIRLYLYNHYI